MDRESKLWQDELSFLFLCFCSLNVRMISYRHVHFVLFSDRGKFNFQNRHRETRSGGGKFGLLLEHTAQVTTLPRFIRISRMRMKKATEQGFK